MPNHVYLLFYPYLKKSEQKAELETRGKMGKKVNEFRND